MKMETQPHASSLCSLCSSPKARQTTSLKIRNTSPGRLLQRAIQYHHSFGGLEEVSCFFENQNYGDQSSEANETIFRQIQRILHTQDRNIPSYFDSVACVLTIGQENDVKYSGASDDLVIDFLCRTCEKLIETYGKYEHFGQISLLKLLKNLNTFQIKRQNHCDAEISNRFFNTNNEIASDSPVTTRGSSCKSKRESLTLTNIQNVSKKKQKRSKVKSKLFIDRNNGQKLDHSKSVCPFCHKIYSIQHSFVHNCLPYRNSLRCDICNVFSSSYVRYEKHLVNFHQKKKLLSCDDKNCKQRFVSKPALQWHSHFHTLELQSQKHSFDQHSSRKTDENQKTSTKEVSVQPQKLSIDMTECDAMSDNFEPIHLAASSISPQIDLKPCSRERISTSSCENFKSLSHDELASLKISSSEQSQQTSYQMSNLQQDKSINLTEVNLATLVTSDLRREDSCGSLPKKYSDYGGDADFENHIIREHCVGKNQFECPVCFINFTSVSNLVDHLDAHGENEYCKCIICSSSISWRSNSINLIPSKDSLLQDSPRCSLCFLTFSTPNDLSEHIISSHKQPYNSHTLKETASISTRTISIKLLPNSSTCSEVADTSSCDSPLQFSTGESRNSTCIYFQKNDIQHDTPNVITPTSAIQSNRRTNSLPNPKSHSHGIANSAPTNHDDYYSLGNLSVYQTNNPVLCYHRNSGQQSNSVSLKTKAENQSEEKVTCDGCLLVFSSRAALESHVCHTFDGKLDSPFPDVSDDNFLPSTENLSVVNALEGSSGSALTPIERLIGSVDDMDYFT